MGRLIRFNNCMQLLACICHVAAIFFEGFKSLADLVSLAAHVVYCLTQACMQAQTDMEMKLHPTVNDYNGQAVMAQPTASDKTPLMGQQPLPSAPPAYNQNMA